MKKIKNLKLTSGKCSVLGMTWWGGKNLLCKLTLGGAFSLAIEIRFRLRRVLARKAPPIEKSTRFRVLFSIGGGGRARTYDLYHVKVAL